MSMDFDLDFHQQVCEPESIYQVNEQLNLAWDIVENTGCNLFLTGKAGTGKTTFLKKLRERSVKNMIVLAPTGVAAINAAGSTIHSFFQLPFSIYLPNKGFLTPDKKYLNISRLKKRIINSLSLLVIDEVSMVRPDILDAIDSIFRRIRRSSRPFGGVQLLLIGDLRQLPPVVREDEWNILKETYSSPYFFESVALKNAGYQTVELSTVYRQTDRSFVDILNKIRIGEIDSKTLSEINKRSNQVLSSQAPEGYIRLTTHNRLADTINQSHLDKISQPIFSYDAIVEGTFPESAFPAEKTLNLKEGAQVMFIKNDAGEQRRFYNGMIGKIVSISENKILVKPLNGDETINVEMAEWENTQYSLDEETKTIKQETIGTFKQFPLHLAWAITIHKSQGLTFDKAIIDTNQAFAPGQTYVALSRCRSLEGLILQRPISLNSIIIDRNVNDFTSYCERNMPDDLTIAQLKENYIIQLLFELFNFESIKISFEEYYRALLDYVVPKYPTLLQKLDEEIKSFEEKVINLSNKFIKSNLGKSIQSELNSKDSNLAQRIKKGCSYFLDCLNDFNQFLTSIPNKVDKKDHALRIKHLQENLKSILFLKRCELNIISESGFSITIYLKAKTTASLNLDSQINSKANSFRIYRKKLSSLNS